MTLKRFFDAVSASRIAQVRRAAEGGFDIHQRYYGLAALPYAALHAGPKMVQGLLDLGVDVDQAHAEDLGDGPDDLAGATALMVTFLRDYPRKSSEIRRVLVKAGANLNTSNAQGQTPLTYAATLSGEELMQECLDLGADPNFCNPCGDSPMRAMERVWIELQPELHDQNREDCTSWYERFKEILLAAGAAELSQNDVAAMTAIEAKDTTEIASLLDQGPDVNYVTGKSGTLLQWAARNSLWDFCAKLLNRGADPNATIPIDRVPAVAWAVYYAKPKMVRAMVKHGADVQFEFRGETMSDYLPESSSDRSRMQKLLTEVSPERIDPTRRLGLMLQDGNYRALMVAGGGWRVARALAKVIDDAEMIERGKARASTRGLIVISWTDLNKELDWVSVHQLGKCDELIFSSEFAAELSAKGRVDTMLVEYGDTAGYQAYTLFRGGEVVESFELDEGEIKVSSTLRDESELVTEMLDDLLTQYQAYVPCFEKIKLKDIKALGDQYYQHRIVMVD